MGNVDARLPAEREALVEDAFHRRPVRRRLQQLTRLIGALPGRDGAQPTADLGGEKPDEAFHAGQLRHDGPRIRDDLRRFRVRAHVDPGDTERSESRVIPRRHVYTRAEGHRAHLVRLDDDLQAELLDEPSPVEVALDGCDVTVPYPDEVDARNAIGGRWQVRPRTVPCWCPA